MRILPSFDIDTMQRALILAALTTAPIIAHAAPTTPGLAPLAARAGAVATASPSLPVSVRGGSKAEKIEVETEDSLVLAADYYKPKQKGRAPAVVLVHDAGGNRSQLAPIAERLQKQGFGVLTLDLRGHGESADSRFDWSKMKKTERSQLWALAPRDIEAAGRWILGQSEIHSTNLSLVGYGSGCALVLRHALADENVISMTLISPKAKDLGFDVQGDIMELVGLPTHVVDVRNDETERLVAEANSAVKHPYVELLLVSSKKPSVLEDRSTPSKVSKWIDEIASPKKGRG